MTYKDAMRIFTGIMERIVEHFPHQFALEMGINGINDIREFNKTVTAALEKADKYRWHDLRKNPDDLPEAIGGGYESEYVLVMIGTPEWNSWEQAYYHHGKRLCTTYEQNVFAWRYIEPFKEEADEE